ncbi:tyrosine-type recombinase/integrase [Streptomyces sp. NPDC058740]|uniref:tyrosine-type recombinase/integrase n=1 Tax=Streptomyces sp. NPDC058740 TaxID=3346619 RepID=UPI003691D1DC
MLLESGRNVANLVVPPAGRLVAVGDPVQPYRVIDPEGREAEAVSDFLKDLRARDLSVETLRSYARALLRWQRFLWAVDHPWERASRTEVRDFVLWLQQARKPARPRRPHAPRPGSVNVITGKRYTGTGYAPRTINHNLTVVKEFYDFQADAGRGPLVNLVPRPREADAAGRLHAHRNPMERYQRHRRAPYRQKEPKRIPRSIPDRLFDELFARMPSDRDRAILAFYVSTGARASELLGVTGEFVDIGQQLIGVHRKGTRELQWLPASADAFVWLRLYQQAARKDGVRFSSGKPLWVTRRRPFRPLNYAAFRAVLLRANKNLGTNWTLHDLRHTAAHRMIDDPQLSLADVQWVLGHAHITSTQIYLEPRQEDVVAKVLAHHAAARSPERPTPQPAPGYRPEVFDALFGGMPT